MMRFRPATMSDARHLFIWRNDAVTREMSRNHDLIEWDSHAAWLEKRLAREKPDLYIVEIDDRPIGTFRIDGDEISFTVSPAHRRKGYATEMLKIARALFGEKRAEIFRRNEASIKVATRAGHRVVLI